MALMDHTFNCPAFVAFHTLLTEAHAERVERRRAGPEAYARLPMVGGGCECVHEDARSGAQLAITVYPHSFHGSGGVVEGGASDSGGTSGDWDGDSVEDRPLVRYRVWVGGVATEG